VGFAATTIGAGSDCFGAGAFTLFDFGSADESPPEDASLTAGLAALFQTGGKDSEVSPLGGPETAARPPDAKGALAPAAVLDIRTSPGVHAARQ
jgi:hypothetical protein